MAHPLIHTDEKELTILGWPTDTVSVQHDNDKPHTLLIFVPGNPGCIGWYTLNLVELVTRLGRGYGARGISYAGHGLNDRITNVEKWLGSKDRDTTVPWTVDGQIKHKIAYMEMLMSELKDRHHSDNFEFIFLGHSIGNHMIQRMLLLRPDILRRTKLFLQLMPFTRMKAPKFMDKLLNGGAGSPHVLISVSQRILQVLQRMPIQWVDELMKSTIQDEDGRNLAVNLLRQPQYAKNFFELGTEEIRDLPDVPDVSCSYIHVWDGLLISDEAVSFLCNLFLIDHEICLLEYVRNMPSESSRTNVPSPCCIAERITGRQSSTRTISKSYKDKEGSQIIFIYLI